MVNKTSLVSLSFLAAGLSGGSRMTCQLSVLWKSTFNLDQRILLLRKKKINLLYTNYCTTLYTQTTPALAFINTSLRNVPLFCCGSVNPFLRKVLFVATSHQTHYVACGGQQEGYLQQSENSLQTLCLPLDYLDLTHRDELMVSPQT